jgi:uncharacterized protein YggU (UPF0235/DUF167 family)
VVALLASSLDIPKRDITIVSGGSSRTKQVVITGLTEDELRARL